MVIEKAIYKANPTFEWGDENREAIDKIVENLLPGIIDVIEQYILKKSKKILLQEKKKTKRFKASLDKRWGAAFNLLELYIEFNREYAEAVSYTYRNKKVEDIKFETLLRLQARACQIAAEIHIMIVNGFADGAMARWRSLYEIAVLAEFLLDKPDELIQKYLDYSIVENYNEAIEYQKNHELLDYPALEEEEMAEMERLLQEQINKYGQAFIKPYGWAKEYLPKSRCNFAGMESCISFNEFNSFYKLANHFVHSGSKGFLFKMGLYNPDEVMLAGPSNYGFTDPAQLTALFLHIVSSTLSDFDFHLEDIVYKAIREKMIERIGEMFMDAQTEIEKNYNHS